MALQSFSCSSESSPSSSLPFTPEPGPSSSTAISTSTSNLQSLSAVSSLNWFANSTALGFNEDIPERNGPINNTGEVLGIKSRGLVSLEAGLFSEFTILREEEDTIEEDEEKSFEQCSESEPLSKDLEEQFLSQSVQRSSLSSACLNGHQSEVDFIAESSLAPQPHFACSSTPPHPPLPPETSPPSKPIFIHYFYPLDPATSIQQQNPVYDNPECRIVRPIPVWPPPELAEWRKLKRKAPGYDTMEGGRVAGKKRKADESSEDEEYRPSATAKRAVKRVRWKSVDDIAPAPVFKSMTPVAVDTQKRPFISLPIKGSVDKSLYRAISVPHLSPSPSPSDDEDMASQLGRGMRRQKLTIKLSFSLDRGECKPSTKRPRSFGPLCKPSTKKPRSFGPAFKTSRPSGPVERTCHQCRNSKPSPQPPKMKCSAIKSNGQPCSLVYCVGCIINRYDEPFEASATTWTCPFCREICNCSLCIRRGGFGYIWDGPFAEDIRQGKVSNRGFKDAGKQWDSNPMPSRRKWFARQGVVTGSSAWMSQRRKEGVRFIVGRSPSPGLDSSSTFAGDCGFVQQFEKEEKEMDDEGEGTVEREATSNGALEQQAIPIDSAASPSSSSSPLSNPDDASVQQTIPIKSTASPSSSNSPLPNPNDVFLRCRSGRKKRFYIGQILKRVGPPYTATPRTKALVVGVGRGAQKDDRPKAKKFLRPPSKQPGFYVEVHEDGSEEKESENKAEAQTVAKTDVTVVQNELVPQLEPEPVSSSEPTLSYPTSTSISDPTPNSTPGVLYPSTSLGTLNPSNLHEFRDLHSPVPTQVWSSSALNAQGLALEKSLADNANNTAINTEVANWSDATAPPVVNSSSSHSEIIGPSRMPLNPEDDFTLPLPDIYTFTPSGPLASGVESWFAAGGGNNSEDEDVDAIGETETEKSTSVGVDER